MNYSLIIPVYNEIKTLPSLLKCLEKLDSNIEIIIIDDGSDDGTEKMIKNNPKNIYLRNNKNIGKGESIKRGADIAKNEFLIFIDGDLEINLTEIPDLILEFQKSKPDVLTGVRWNKNEKNYVDLNAIGNFIINHIFNFLFKSKMKDVLCCVKIISKSLFQSLKIKSNRFSIEVETMAKLVMKNVIIKEVNVRYKRRTAKEGKKLKYSDSWIIIWKMIQLKLFTKI